MTRRLRIGTGLVLFVYVATHLINVALGLYSVELMEAGRPYFQGLWTSPPGIVLLGGAFLVHGALGLHALFWRNTFRMTRLDAAQLITSLGIVPLLVPHVVGTVVAADLFYYDPTFQSILGLFWVDSPSEGLRQVFTLVFVWVHGVIGLFTWMRVQRWWSRVSGLLYPLAVIIPVLALMGFVHAGKELIAPAEQTAIEETANGEAAVTDEAAGEEMPDAGEQAGAGEQAAAGAEEEHAPPTGEAFIEAVHTLDRIDRRAIVIFALLVGATLLARWARLRHDRAKLHIAWVNGPDLSVDCGPSVLEVATMHHVPHAHLCRGRGRCGTCRVRIVETEFPLPPPNDTERHTLARVGADADVRLACQLLPHGGRLVVERLVAPDIRPSDLRRRHRQATETPGAAVAEPAE